MTEKQTYQNHYCKECLKRNSGSIIIYENSMYVFWINSIKILYHVCKKIEKIKNRYIKWNNYCKEWLNIMMNT